jgi:hypothetical protein
MSMHSVAVIASNLSEGISHNVMLMAKRTAPHSIIGTWTMNIPSGA